MTMELELFTPVRRVRDKKNTLVIKDSLGFVHTFDREGNYIGRMMGKVKKGVKYERIVIPIEPPVSARAGHGYFLRRGYMFVMSDRNGFTVYFNRDGTFDGFDAPVEYYLCVKGLALDDVPEYVAGLDMEIRNPDDDPDFDPPDVDVFLLKDGDE